MCYKPLSIRVKSKYFSPSYSSPVIANVPCGKCMDCQHKKRDEVLFRSFYEAYNTIHAGGFVLSQALTYSESNVPHISEFFNLNFSDGIKTFVYDDHYCFRRSDIRSFMMRLRNHLTRDLGLDVANKLKYLIVAEYGTSNEGTHRPHYHCLFFSTIVGLTWKKLSAAIDLCWPHGLSDSVLRYPETYFINDKKPHVFSLDGFHDTASLERAISYVTDYLVKDSVFEMEITKRLQNFCDFVHASNPQFDLSDFIRKFRRNCCQFRLNSPHFGEDFTAFNKLEDVFNTGRISMPHSDDKYPTLSIPLPLYYARKLFYDLKKDFDGTLKWCLNEYGEKYRYKQISDYLKTFERKYSDIYLFAPTDVRCRINALLDGRSIRDFVNYIILYKGRFITGYRKQIALPPILQQKNICHTLYYKDPVGSSSLDTFPEYRFRYYCQDTLNQFRYFDDLFQLFSEIQMSTNELKQTSDTFVQQLIKSLKNNDPKTTIVV